MGKSKLNLVWGFKRKLYGWGWATILVYIGLILGLVLTREEAIPGNPDSGSNFLVFALPIIISTVIFFIILYKKGESPRWQWGVSKK